MRIVLIRHGLTAGNLEKRYIGKTDEPLCSEGVAALAEMSYPRCGLLVSSPMLRCIQSCEVLFPGQRPSVCGELRECDFGDFEGKNYTELSGDPRYQSWIDSGGEATFPNGESPQDFRDRCAAAFEKIVGEHCGEESAAFVVHGGTIMAIMERFAQPHRPYFDWQTPNGHGYVCHWDGKKLKLTEKI